MPANTPSKQIPYPLSGDDPRIAPTQVFQPLANRVDALFKALDGVTGLQILSGTITHAAVTAGNSLTAIYEFPANNWTAPPILVASGGSNARCNVIGRALSTSQFQVELFNPTTTDSGTTGVNWIAIGPTS